MRCEVLKRAAVWANACSALTECRPGLLLALQAADLSSALQALLKQAQSQLKPPSRSAAPAAQTAPATRQALVWGVLLLLERAAVLATQQQDLAIIKVRGLSGSAFGVGRHLAWEAQCVQHTATLRCRAPTLAGPSLAMPLLQDAVSQLVAAFQQHGWLWELLLHKHLPDLLQHPAAAQLFAKALGRLPSAAQARALHVWRQKLSTQPGLAERVPMALAQLWLEQLGESFQSHRITLPVVPGLLGQPTEAAAPAGAAVGSGLAADAAAGAAAAATEVHVVLREQLPHLLQLLLLLTCSSDAGGAVTPGAPAGGSAASPGSRDDAPCLSSMQSAATEVRPPRGGRQQQQQQQSWREAAELPAGFSSASAGSGGGAGAASPGTAACRHHVQEGVLRHAVLLIGQLSSPDALHTMLDIRCRQQDPAAGNDSDGEPEQQGEDQRQPAAGSGAAENTACVQTQHDVLTVREANSARTAQALIEVCLDGMLTLQPLAAAVHDQLHSKGNSSGGNGGGTTPACEQQQGSACAAAAAAAGCTAGDAADEEHEEQAAAALAELRHTVGRMLGLHRELSRLLDCPQQPGGCGGNLEQAGRGCGPPPP